MKITDAKVFVCSPGRNFVTVKIYTDEGIYGLGDGTLNGRELAVASYLEDHLLPCLIGKNPSQIEDIWRYFYKGAYWRRGPVTMSAIGAIDMALWDIKGKALKTPVYNLLGGRSRKGVMVYGHANGKDIEETVDEVGKYIEKGYLAIRAQTGVPGLPSTYGVSPDKLFYEPAEKGLPPENVWSTEKYLNHVPKLFKKLRDVYGDDPHLLHDCHHRLTPIEAGRLGKELEPYHLFWLEDTVPAELQEGFRIIRNHTTTPLAVGEVFNVIYDYTTLITEQLIDYIRMSIVHGGGLTPMMKIASFADIYHVRTGCHGPTDVSPVTMAAALHFETTINNFGIQEFMRHTSETNEVFLHHYYFENGYLNVKDEPGLGVDFNEKLAAKYPYERAYLPINRKLDGTMYNW
ncbi:D-mannonate dehydratase ManD [Coxiella endosymbiont of Ornithodoros maritimus]|uniref:D-mannonate dehydratase ManD n=1 Tax=Coxiella endosymbiont of Ornithodoros maritimus TaxID=1656172 RepID=UPI00226405A5|nr:D-mannonate dehydratase ManD [Coxiella endosymbiont of Ornithodoros maritimus]